MAPAKCYICDKKENVHFMFPSDPSKVRRWCILLKCKTPDITGRSGPRLCSNHFSPSDIIVTAKSTKLRSSALPKIEKSQTSESFISKDILLVSRDGVQFPSNSSNLARRSPLIRNLLGDCPLEVATILIDIESTILDTVLELLHESCPTFPSRLYDSVKEALDIFQIADFVIVEEVKSMPRKLCKQRKRRTPALGLGLEGGANNIDKVQAEVEYKEGNASLAQNDNIDCPYTDCQKKLKGKSSFLNHLCLIHHRNELESKIMKMEGGKFKCPQENCNLDSMNKRFVISHYGIRHNVINQFLAKSFPNHTYA